MSSNPSVTDGYQTTRCKKKIKSLNSYSINFKIKRRDTACLKAKQTKYHLQTEAPHGSANARMSVPWSKGGAVPKGAGRRVGGGWAVWRVGEPVPSGGILSGKPVVVALMNLARATTSAGVDQMGDSWSSEVTPGRKRVLAQARGGQERTAWVKLYSSEEHRGQVASTGSPCQAGLWAAR